jgi:DNA-binding cell septation regulator SpoVG
MEVKVRSIAGPTEPTVYAIASVEVIDQTHSIVIRGLEVLEGSSGLGVSFPGPRQEDYLGGGDLFELSPSLKQRVADLVLEAYDRGIEKFAFGPKQDAQTQSFGLVFRATDRDAEEIGAERKR